MARVKLQILAEDIKNSNYLYSSNCAITKALERAGYSEYHDAGTDICKRNDGEDILIDNSNKTYAELTEKVRAMYRNKELKEGIIEDFEHELIF
jgi:hypothetical protein